MSFFLQKRLRRQSNTQSQANYHNPFADSTKKSHLDGKVAMPIQTLHHRKMQQTGWQIVSE
ncbi:hypothetical protein E4U61_004341, partial [Claviceps capensis]